MSTAPQAPTPQTSPPPPPAHREIRIVSHSSLYYWWPVWAAGFIFAIISYFSGQRMATVPSGTDVGLVEEKAHAKLFDEKKLSHPLENHFVLIVDKDKVKGKTLEDKV